MDVIKKKILLVGDIEVGKTSILTKYFDNNAPEVIEPTMGIEFKTKIFKRGNNLIKLRIWDTSGQEKFKSITQNYFCDADSLLYVFDVTNENSLNNIKNWLEMSEKNNNKNFIKILIGNKTDLDEGIIEKEQMEQFLADNNMDILFEISAKNGKGISKMFEDIVDLLIKNEPTQNIESSDVNDTYEEVKENNKSDCGYCIIN